MKIYTIGFTKKSAEEFFETLRSSGARRLVDVRLNNVSQLAGFAKKQDLAYFLGKICGMDYVHLPLLAQRRKSSMSTGRARETGRYTKKNFSPS
jgi:uncharacterized protein (DUF488 family)